MKFVISKAQEPTRKPWSLYRLHGDAPSRVFLGTYETRKEALTAGRLLAGWRGTVEVEK